MKKLFKKVSAIFLTAVLCMTACYTGVGVNVSAIAVGDPDYKSVDNADLTIGTFVYEYNVMDYGADNTGNNDNYDIFQSIINKISSLGGGTMYIPSGKYRVNGTLRTPKGVTIRGDWAKPTKGSAITGTILMAYTGRNGTITSDPFIKMEPESGVMNVAIWYPEQTPDNITPYSPTITMGCDDVWGNEFCNVKDITLVNSYIGIQFSTTNGGASPIVNGVYGTTLHTAVDVDNIADVGRVDWLDLSPKYWAGSGLNGSPSMSNTTYTNYIYNNSTGLVMRRNDWSYASYINIEGYYEGFRADNSVSEPGNNPNGHNYDFNFTDCKNGIVINHSSYCGIMFTSCTLINCENGIVLNSGSTSPVQLTDIYIDASKYAVKTDQATTATLTMTQSTVARGNVYVKGGTFIATDNDFNNPSPQIFLGVAGYGNFVGNRFKNTRSIVNNSLYDYNYSDDAISAEDAPEVIRVVPKSCSPAKNNLYVVTKAPYNAVANGNNDCTTAIQNALNDAGNNGGGIVYLPAGHYKVTQNLTVPSGVEIRGSADVSSVPHGVGTTIEVYAGRNTTQNAFMVLKENAGVRGITFNYPEQSTTSLNLDSIVQYPYTIQGQGANVYVVNVKLRACWQGVDFFTYKCDNHYVDYLTGHVFKTCIRVGGGSENGLISNIQVNVIVYACGGESKFGSWGNSPAQGSDTGFLYTYSYQNLEFMVLGDCKNEMLYDDFHYGSKKGIILQSDGNGGPQELTAIGLGIDAARQSIYLDSGLTGTYDFVNTQIVSLGGGDPNYSLASYLYAEPNSDFTLNINGIDNWGFPQTGIVMGENTGTINLQSANYDQMGASGFLNINGGKLNISTSRTKSTNNFLVSGSTSHLSAEASVIGSTEQNQNGAAEWSNNVGYNINLSGTQVNQFAMDRNGWQVSASNNNGNAGNSIDGNIETRWDTAGAQANGQWYMVNFGSQKNFNAILLNVGSSTGDGANTYEIYVSNDGNNWGNAVKNGNNGQGVIEVGNQTAQYIRILQTGTQSGYWSIHEFFLLNLSATDPNFPTQPTEPVYPEGGSIENQPFDLYASTVACEQTAPNNGDNVTFYVILRNIGENATGGAINVTFFVDGREVQTLSVTDSIAASGMKSIVSTVTWPAFFGSHSVKVSVSPADASLDTDTSNNLLKSRFTVTDN